MRNFLVEIDAGDVDWETVSEVIVKTASGWVNVNEIRANNTRKPFKIGEMENTWATYQGQTIDQIEVWTIAFRRN